MIRDLILDLMPSARVDLIGRVQSCERMVDAIEVVTDGLSLGPNAAEVLRVMLECFGRIDKEKIAEALKVHAEAEGGMTTVRKALEALLEADDYDEEVD